MHGQDGRRLLSSDSYCWPVCRAHRYQIHSGRVSSLALAWRRKDGEASQFHQEILAAKKTGCCRLPLVISHVSASASCSLTLIQAMKQQHFHKKTRNRNSTEESNPCKHCIKHIYIYSVSYMRTYVYIN